MKRRHLTKSDKAAILAKSEGRCACCGGEFTKDDPVEFDHIIALELGGEDTNENTRAIHEKACHRPKTALDIKAIAKGKRQRKKFGATPAPVTRFKQKIKSAGFRKDVRRKLNGGIERRDGPARIA
jgi:5-methylcytosine-specific restriction endonuclease McrA